MIHNNKKYISLLETYVEENKISNLENEDVRDFHANNYFIVETNIQQPEEKVDFFKDDTILGQSLTSKEGVPGQNIAFLFYYSIFFSVALCLIIAVLLKTQKYTNIDTTFPKRVFLFSFFLGNLSYSNQTFNNEFGPINAGSNISQVYIDDAVFINSNNSKQTLFAKTAFANDEMHHPLLSIYDNTIEFNQDHGRNLQIHSDVVITGRLKATSISFGPFKIEHNILTNVLDPSIQSDSQLLSSSDINHIVTDFLFKDKYLAVSETNKILIFYLDPKQIKCSFDPILIYQKILNDQNEVCQIDSSEKDIFNFFFDDNNNDKTISVGCKDKKCEQLILNSKNEKHLSSDIFDKFGAKIDLIEINEKCNLNYCFDKDDCTKIPIRFGSNSSSINCGTSKISVNEDGNVYVVIPEKKIVRLFEDINNELLYKDEPLNISIGSKYQPIQRSSFLISLNEGILDIFSF